MALNRIIGIARSVGTGTLWIFVRPLMWCFAAILTVFLMLQIALWGGLAWLNSNGGQNFLQKSLGQTLEGSGYQVAFDGFSYVLPTHLYLGHMTVYKGDEAYVDIKSLRLNIDVLPWADKTADLALRIGALTLFEQEASPSPAAADKKPIFPIIVPAFEVPDIHFTKINLSELSIAKLSLKKRDGTEISASPKLSGVVVVENSHQLRVQLNAENKSENAPDFWPEIVTIKAGFDSEDAHLVVDQIYAISPLYEINGTADATLQEAVAFDMNLNVMQKTIADLSPMKITAHADNSSDTSGIVSVRGTYLKKEVSLLTTILMQDQAITLKDFRIKAPDISIGGDLTVAEGAGFPRGILTGQINSLKSYQDFVGAGHDISPIKFEITLRDADDIGLALRMASYSNRDISVSLNDIVMQAALAGQNANITKLTARGGGQGSMQATANFNLTDHSFDAVVKAQKWDVLKGDIVNGQVDVDIKASGVDGNYNANGTILTDKLDIKLPERFAQSIPQLNIVDKKTKKAGQTPDIAKALTLDIVFDAPSQIFVRGWGLDAEFGGKVRITGSADNPQFEGGFKVLRGRYTEFGKVFKLAKAEIKFLGSVPPYPKFDILAQTKADDILAQVGIAGSVENPKITFSSVPPMPQDEVLSYILFGHDMQDISPFQAVQLAQTLQRFSGNGGGKGMQFDPVGALRSATGLDDLRVETDEAGGASVGMGKYLTDDVYLEFEAGSQEGSGNANIQVELTPSITLESKIGQDANGGAGVFWKHDY